MNLSKIVISALGLGAAQAVARAPSKGLGAIAEEEPLDGICKRPQTLQVTRSDPAPFVFDRAVSPDQSPAADLPSCKVWSVRQLDLKWTGAGSVKTEQGQMMPEGWEPFGWDRSLLIKKCVKPDFNQAREITDRSAER